MAKAFVHVSASNISNNRYFDSNDKPMMVIRFDNEPRKMHYVHGVKWDGPTQLVGDVLKPLPGSETKTYVWMNVDTENMQVQLAQSGPYVPMKDFWDAVERGQVITSNADNTEISGC